MTLTAADAIAWTTRLISIGALISTLELLANARQFDDDGLYSWRIVGSRAGILRRPWLHAGLRRLLDRPWIVGLLGLRAAGCGVLLVAPTRLAVAAPALTAVLAVTLLVNLRSAYGQDGSDQMTTQVFAALWINLFATPENHLTVVCLAYVAGQSCLSYLASGVAKLLGRPWRDGTAVFLIFNTRTYGTVPVARWLGRHPRTGWLLTWSVNLAETAFPLVLVAGRPACWLFLGWGVAFHLLNAGVMGLNGFLWAFVATYPAILYWVLAIEAWLSGA